MSERMVNRSLSIFSALSELHFMVTVLVNRDSLIGKGQDMGRDIEKILVETRLKLSFPCGDEYSPPN